MIVRVGRWFRDPKAQCPRGNHPGKAVQCMPGERGRIRLTLAEYPDTLRLASSGVRDTACSTASRSAGNKTGATVNSIGDTSRRLMYSAKPGARRPIHPAENHPNAPRTDVAETKPGMSTLGPTGSSGSRYNPGRITASLASTSENPPSTFQPFQQSGRSCVAFPCCGHPRSITPVSPSPPVSAASLWIEQPKLDDAGLYHDQAYSITLRDT